MHAHNRTLTHIIHMQTCPHVNIHSHPPTCVHSHELMCPCTNARVNSHAHIHMYAETHMPTHTRANELTPTHTCMLTCMRTQCSHILSPGCVHTAHTCTPTLAPTHRAEWPCLQGPRVPGICARSEGSAGHAVPARGQPSRPLATAPGPRPQGQAHRLISDLQTSSKLYSLALVGWKITSSSSVSSGRMVPNPSLG